ncbi:MAG: DUF3137 domain-containing protein [Cyclobacteriaceae bacterium]
MLDPIKIYKDLKDQLYELDKERIKCHNKVEPFRYSFWSVFVLGGSFLIARLNLSRLDGKLISEDNLAYVIIGYGATVFVTLIAFLTSKHHYEEKFKKMFVAEIAPYIIRGLDPSFKYDYEGQIPRMEIISSLLFGPFNTYECQDLVMGVIDDVPVKFAEIKLQKVVVKKNSKRYDHVFNGLFYRADLQVSFPTDIWMVSARHSVSAREEGKKRIKLDHGLARDYKIFADSEEKAKLVLQPFILDKINSLNKSLKAKKIITKPLSYHFGEHWVQVAISTRSKFMEPRLSRTIDHVSFIEEQTAVLNSVASLIEDLTLK